MLKSKHAASDLKSSSKSLEVQGFNIELYTLKVTLQILS